MSRMFITVICLQIWNEKPYSIEYIKVSCSLFFCSMKNNVVLNFILVVWCKFDCYFVPPENEAGLFTSVVW